MFAVGMDALIIIFNLFFNYSSYYIIELLNYIKFVNNKYSTNVTFTSNYGYVFVDEDEDLDKAKFCKTQQGELTKVENYSNNIEEIIFGSILGAGYLELPPLMQGLFFSPPLPTE